MLMKKIFTLFAAAVMALSASADTVYLNNHGKVKQNILAGEEMGAPEGWTLKCMNEGKNLESGSSMTINDEAMVPIKFSNGAQNTLTLPEGFVVTKLTFYATINKDAATERPCYWAEVGGVQYTVDDNKGIIDSYKDFENPNVQSFDIDNQRVVTFKNTGEQPFAIIAVDYTKASGITDINVDNANAPVEYFNLQGIRVENPANGLYIRRQGNKVEKVYVK